MNSPIPKRWLEILALRHHLLERMKRFANTIKYLSARFMHILSSFDHPIALTLIAYSH